MEATMNTPLWLRAVVQAGIAVALFALVIPVAFGIAATLDAIFKYPDLHDPFNEPGHLICFGVVYLLLGASAAAVSRRAVRRIWDALMGVGLFALIFGWWEWQVEIQLQSEMDPPATGRLAFVVGLSVLTGCVLSAALLRRRVRASSSAAVAPPPP